MASPPVHEEESPSALDNLGATVQANLQTQDERNPAHHPSVPGMGETYEQHVLHDRIAPKHHFGLSQKAEATLFYCCAIPSWALEIAAAVIASYDNTHSRPFIACMTAFMALHWWAWLQTAVGMMQRASWVRDESDLNDRRQFLYLAVRLNRLMMPTAVIALAVFIQAYARRYNTRDLAYWLLFLLTFIWNIVFSVMNAYNNITWESDRFAYEEGGAPFKYTRLAILGIGVPNKESKDVKVV